MAHNGFRPGDGAAFAKCQLNSRTKAKFIQNVEFTVGNPAIGFFTMCAHLGPDQRPKDNEPLHVVILV